MRDRKRSHGHNVRRPKRCGYCLASDTVYKKQPVITIADCGDQIALVADHGEAKRDHRSGLSRRFEHRGKYDGIVGVLAGSRCCGRSTSAASGRKRALELVWHIWRLPGDATRAVLED